MIKLKRAYEPASENDGYRVLVERLWPRGVAKQDARFDAWLKDISPSSALRKWYGHDVNKWPEFKRKYMSELKDHIGTTDEIRHRAKTSVVTFIYAARDEEHNSAVVLKEFIEGDESKWRERKDR